MMRVLFLHTSLEHGGLEQQMLTLASGLRDRGHKVIIAAAPGPAADIFEEAQIDMVSLPDPKKQRGVGRMQMYAKCWSVLKTMHKDYDLINLQSRFLHPVGTALAHRLKLPLVMTVHNDFESGRMYPWHADSYIAVSSVVARSLAGRFGIEPDRIHVVHNGIPDEKPASPTATTNAPSRLFTACRLVEEKGINVLLDAMPQICTEVPGAELVIAGEGPLMEELRTKVRKSKLEKSVIFAGWEKNISTRYADAAVTILASTRLEGFGLVALEAMRASRPVVSTLAGGITDVVKHNETGLLVKPGDPKALASAIIDLIRDPDKAERLGCAGRARYEALFSADRMIEETLKVYSEALRKKR
jgi:glycosyltransferase involved in cell wall biosynthesis